MDAIDPLDDELQELSDSFDPLACSDVSDSMDPEGLRHSCSDFSVRCARIDSGRYLTNPRGWSISSWYRVLTAALANSRHAPSEVTITVRPTRAANGRVNNKKRGKLGAAVPSSSRVCNPNS